MAMFPHSHPFSLTSTPVPRAATALAALTAMLAVTPVMADDATALDGLVVTPAGYEQQLRNAPASISVIDRESLEDRYYGDVTDALRDIPGVTITGGGAGSSGADISMRGMPASYTKILVDGRPQNTRETRPNGSAGFEQDWLPPLSAIERIEVIRGPMSTLYGSDAIGGVINIITRKVPDEWHGNLRMDQVVQENRDSGDIHQSSFHIGGPLHEDLLGLQLFGEYQSRAEDEIVNGYEQKRMNSGTARLAFTPGDNHEFTLEAGVTRQNRQQTVGKTVPTSGCRGGCEDSDSTYSHTHYALSHTGHLALGTVRTYVQREVSENRGREIEITNTNAKSSIMMPLGSHNVTVGANYTLEELDDETTNQISERTQVEHDKYAVFAEDEWFLARTFSLTGGVRVDDDENYGSHVSPRLYGVWNVHQAWTVKGGVSTGYRSPSLREITPDWGTVSRGGDIYGNPDLEPETSVNKELALLYASPSGINASLAVFHNDFEDKITRVECPATVCPGGPNQFGRDPTYRINVDEAVTRGVEASLSMPLTERLLLSASYTYTDSEQKTGEYKGLPLTQLPEHQGTAELEWQATDRLAPWTRVTYRGRETQPVEGPSSQGVRAPSYTFVDAGMRYRLTDRTRVRAAVYNVLDEDVTYDEYGYVEDGRRLWLGLSTDF